MQEMSNLEEQKIYSTFITLMSCSIECIQDRLFAWSRKFHLEQLYMFRLMELIINIPSGSLQEKFYMW